MSSHRACTATTRTDTLRGNSLAGLQPVSMEGSGGRMLHTQLVPRWFLPVLAAVLVLAPAAGWFSAPTATPEAARPEVQPTAPSTVEPVGSTTTTAQEPAAVGAAPSDVVHDSARDSARSDPATEARPVSAEPEAPAPEPAEQPAATTTVPSPAATATTAPSAVENEPWCMGRDDRISGSPPGQKCIPGDGSEPYWGPGSCPPEQRTEQGCA